MSMAIMGRDDQPQFRHPKPLLQFRMEDETGKVWFIHMLDISKLTSDDNYAWCGNSRQAFNVRKANMKARTMPLVPVTKPNNIRRD